MSKAQALMGLVRQHLTAAAEEICGLFEAAMVELEEETRRQCSLLLEARVEPRRTGADINSLDVRKDEFLPKQQNRTSRLDKEDAVSSHVKKEHEQLQVPRDAVVTEFHPVPVKNEEDQYLYCSQTEKRIDCGQESHPDNKMTPPSQPETKLRCEKSSKAPQILSDVLKGRNSKEKAVCCSACGKRFSKNSNLKTHMRIHTGEKPFGCTFCSKRFVQKVHLRHHMARHTGEKPLGCSTCDQRFNWLYQLKTHQCVKAGLVHREASEQVKASQTGVLGLNKYRNSLSCYECRETFTHKSHFKEPTQLHSAAETSDDPFAAEFFLGDKKVAK